jgi:hypothetical protein
MRSWKSVMLVAGAIGFVVAAVGSEATADSQTKPKTEQATETGKGTMPPKAEAKPEEAGQEAASHEAKPGCCPEGHEGSHTDHEGSHAEEDMDEGSH